MYKSIKRNKRCDLKKLCKYVKNGNTLDIPVFKDIPTKQEIFNTLALYETLLKGVGADKQIGNIWTVKSMLRKLKVENDIITKKEED